MSFFAYSYFQKEQNEENKSRKSGVKQTVRNPSFVELALVCCLPFGKALWVRLDRADNLLYPSANSHERSMEKWLGGNERVCTLLKFISPFIRFRAQPEPKISDLPTAIAGSNLLRFGDRGVWRKGNVRFVMDALTRRAGKSRFNHLKCLVFSTLPFTNLTMCQAILFCILLKHLNAFIQHDKPRMNKSSWQI